MIQLLLNLIHHPSFNREKLGKTVYQVKQVDNWASSLLPVEETLLSSVLFIKREKKEKRERKERERNGREKRERKERERKKGEKEGEKRKIRGR